MRMTPTSSTVKSGERIGKVPGDGGPSFFFARLPATASMGTIMKKRPTSIAVASDKLYQCVLALSPAKAEPLFPVAEVYAERSSERPCGPVFVSAERPRFGIINDTAVKHRIDSGKIST